MKLNFEDIGLHVPEILLPAEGCDLPSWSVVACDQFTSQPDYWDDVSKIVGSKPSTLHITLPEIYLKTPNQAERVAAINDNMSRYLANNTLICETPGFILLDRSTPANPSRKGLMIAVDLEKYDFTAGSQSLIRATEGTVLDRLPPRVKVRENAPLELPHILMLIDDPEKTVIEPLYSKKDNLRQVYDFDLIKEGGHIKGWKIDDQNLVLQVADALEKLADPALFKQKYLASHQNSSSAQSSNSAVSVAWASVHDPAQDLNSKPNTNLGVLLFAVGDGNHSLATAKVHWENIKKAMLLNNSNNAFLPQHPARYALVELVNVHDSGIVFEPIHRVLFNTDTASLLSYLTLNGATIKYFNTYTEAQSAIEIAPSSVQHIPFICQGKFGILNFTNPRYNLAVGTLQSVLDNYLSAHTETEIDYIHGDDVVTKLATENNAMGFYLPPMDKNDLFKTVVLDGVLPRKTFSMGEANEKRYYLECRKIK